MQQNNRLATGTIQGAGNLCRSALNHCHSGDSGRHLLACFRAPSARFCARLAVCHLVLIAFGAAGVTDLRAKLAALLRERALASSTACCAHRVRLVFTRHCGGYWGAFRPSQLGNSSRRGPHGTGRRCPRVNGGCQSSRIRGACSVRRRGLGRLWCESSCGPALPDFVDRRSRR